MDFSTVDAIKANGFEGFLSIQNLSEKKCRQIPETQGVYMVLCLEQERPQFIHPGTGGFYKNKNPNVATAILQKNWVDNSVVLYIGKAGGTKCKTSLKKRIQTYLKFGRGKKVAHQGGRFIWQLEGAENLLFCWKTTTIDAQEVEQSLIDSFVEQYNQMPFANHRR
ncbi:MAG: hypothetical protein HND56_03435 [Pseudomonadota bacterium]|nr:hypothetical protein [Pseudomonadota bacterium]QKK04798.1 MAG: hypothetical protein HND56_03435 [Pseudomonadota bacterium]